MISICKDELIFCDVCNDSEPKTCISIEFDNGCCNSEYNICKKCIEKIFNSELSVKYKVIKGFF